MKLEGLQNSEGGLSGMDYKHIYAKLPEYACMNGICEWCLHQHMVMGEGNVCWSLAGGEHKISLPLIVGTGKNKHASSNFNSPNFASVDNI